VRRRALLLALLVGGLSAAGATGPAGSVAASHDRPSDRAALAHADLADVPAPSAFSRARDALERDHHDRVIVPAVLGMALLTLAGGWWLARERAARVRRPLLIATRRTRAPPRQFAIVHC
jgi:hypothetical protein